MFKAVSDGVSRINIDAVVTCPSNLHDFLVFLEELKVTPARTANRHVFQITLLLCRPPQQETGVTFKIYFRQGRYLDKTKTPSPTDTRP
mgnify:CR=1 FL=1